MGVLEVIEIFLTAVIGAAVTWTATSLAAFMKRQEEANKANALANRSMQRDVLYRYFHHVVEEGKHITPEEFSHVSDCYDAYHANGGNGAGTLMYKRIAEHAVLDSGR